MSGIKSIAYGIFNLFQRIYSPLSNDKINLIKNTGLFDFLSEQKFQAMIKSARLEKIAQGKIIFEEGDLPHLLYIISDGSVEVFTHDFSKQGQKISLARLNKGDYFGEQAMIGQGRHTRNASVITLFDATFIVISSKSLFPLLKENEKLTNKLKTIGFDQAIYALTSSISVYSEVRSIIDKLYQMDPAKRNIIEFKDKEIIFRFGDEPKNVYLVLQGEVILKPPSKDTNKSTKVIIHRGHFFGVIGVFENKPRSATAIANGDVHLLVIDGEHFKSIHEKEAQLQYLLSAIRLSYQLPTQGTIEQYISKTPEMGNTIISTYKMEDGRTIVAMCAINNTIFSMRVSNTSADSDYKYTKNERTFIKLLVTNNRLVGIEAYGETESLPTLCHMLLDNKIIKASLLEKFAQTGEIEETTPKVVTGTDEIICTCLTIKRSSIQNLIDSGVKDIDSLSQKTGICTVCGCCRNIVLEMLGQNPWISAAMKKVIKHNPQVHSYYIKPTTTQFKPYLPGQNIAVQAKILNNWVERSYTMTNTIHDNEPLRITIKKEPKGLFTQWLFEEAADEIEVNVTQPRGMFILNKDENTPAICFAGGIGITPFIAYVKELAATHSHKKLHLLYCVKKKEDFIFVDELTNILESNPSITITWRTTSSGSLIKNEIIDLVKSMDEPDIYICGPEGFLALINKTLQEYGYNCKKIHIEQFWP